MALSIRFFAGTWHGADRRNTGSARRVPSCGAVAVGGERP